MVIGTNGQSTEYADADSFWVLLRLMVKVFLYLGSRCQLYVQERANYVMKNREKWYEKLYFKILIFFPFFLMWLSFILLFDCSKETPLV